MTVNQEDKVERSKQIKKIERLLRYYTYYKVGLMNLQKQLDYIMPEITARYEIVKGTVGTFKLTSQTEKFAIDRIESKKALMLYEDIERYNIIIDSIDEAVSELDPIEREFIEKRYINRMTMKQTAQEMGYSEKYLFNIRNQAMDKLLISLRGLLEF